MKASTLNKIAKEKTGLFKRFIEHEPIHIDVKDPFTKKRKPRCQGEDILETWNELYNNDSVLKSIVIDTCVGPTTPGLDYHDSIDTITRSNVGENCDPNPAMPYQQIRALIGDGGKWKWPEIWKNLDCLPRRGKAWRHIDDISNLGKIENPNPDILPLNCLVVGGGPVGLRLAIELLLGGHRVTIYERRREVIDQDNNGKYEQVGFTNRVNRPHINNFCRNDLDRLNGRNFMTSKMCYPVFTASHSSSIGIDECQMLLLKTALLLGVNFELGVEYEDATVDIDIKNERNQKPTWTVQYVADSKAQESYTKQEIGTQTFDALFGCDGTSSKVRTTQADWLGSTTKRKYKKMFGIVANLRKVKKSKLREMGYNNGLEPEDQRDEMTNTHFYKASYHNYLILHPSMKEMEANNIPQQSVFSFNKSRMETENDELKSILKEYVTKKAEELGIPHDTESENDGFVEAPNDVMAFDFSEFYNCEKSAAFSAPPLSWDVEKDGEWEVQCPLVALCGDAVADPNWLLGKGLQRGWNSALDACFYADNIYNNQSFNGKPPNLDEPIGSPIEWTNHLENLSNLIDICGTSSRESKLTKEMASGTYSEGGPVNIQISRVLKLRNIEWTPQYLPSTEPWYRYTEFNIAVNSNYKGRKLFENSHPEATRQLAIFEHNEIFVDRGMNMKNIKRPTAAMLTWSKRFECSVFWCDKSMQLLEIDGKVAPGELKIKRKEENPSADYVMVTDNVSMTKFKENENVSSTINLTEVRELAERRSFQLKQKVVQTALRGPPLVDQESRSSVEKIIYNKNKAGNQIELYPINGSGNTHVERNQSQSSMQQKEPIQSFAERIEFQNRKTRTSVGNGSDMDVGKSLNTPSRNIRIHAYDLLNISAASPIMPKLRLKTIQYERDFLTARMIHTKAELARVHAEEEYLRSKEIFLEAESRMLKNLLEAHADADADTDADADADANVR